ncbi:sucrase ferredoxin, partial [Nocardia lasii]
TYGRADRADACALLDAADADEVSLPGLRGRSCYPPISQLAEVTVRQQIPATAADLTVHSDPTPTHDPTQAGAAIVTHRDGRRWRVTARTVAAAPRQASCGAAPKPATYLEPAAMEQLAEANSEL